MPCLYRWCLLSLSLSIACDEAPPPVPRGAVAPPVATTPDAPVGWVTPAAPEVSQDGHRISLVGTPLNALVSAEGLELQIVVIGAPAGTKASYGTTTATAGSELELRAPLGPELAERTPGDVIRFDLKIDPKHPLELEFPDGGKVSMPITGIDVPGVKAALEAVATGQPLDFGPDPEGHATYFEAYFGSMAEGCVKGDAPTFGHIDRVAVKTVLPERPGNKSCKATSGNASDLFMEDWEVTVFDRATGEEIGKKTFAAKKKCPFTWLEGRAVSRPEQPPIDRWLAKL